MSIAAEWPGLHEEGESSLFVPGQNCWRVTRTERAAFLIDGEAYFSTFAQAALQARHSIYIIGWDFHSRMRLHSPAEIAPFPSEMGEFLDFLVKRNRSLHIYILVWDFPVVYGFDREWPLYGLAWKPHRRVHLVYDNTHPAGGSHHQKIVVMDDAIAFCGGIDLTRRRWDTCAHAANDHRRTENNLPYPPFHDVMMAVQGETARALGDLARLRWLHATGKQLFRAQPMRAIWPESLRVDVTHGTVAIARTLAPTTATAAVREVEQLYVNMIQRASHSIYIENQYFTSQIIGDAIAARLAEPHGPEIVVVIRSLSHGWLEGAVMHTLRARLVERLRAGDQYGRFHVYYPHVAGLPEGTCLDVHAKLAIVDDEWVRIGSANLANRSMGYDSECDLALEARGDLEVAAAIRRLRAALLAEHLAADVDVVSQELQQHRSIAKVIELHADDPIRTLLPLVEAVPTSDTLMGIVEAGDLERPISIDGLVEIFAPETESTRTWFTWSNIAIVVAVVLVLAAIWKFTPLENIADAEVITRWAEQVRGNAWAPVIVLLAYTPACLIFFPRSLITLFAALAFGSVNGFVFAMTGILLSAYLTYLAGAHMSRSHVRRVAGARLNRLMQVLRRRGLIAITAIRLVPLAPFAVEGLIAGAIHIKRWHFLLGTAIGMLPGTLAAVILGGELETLLRRPASAHWGLIAGAVALVALLTWLVRHWLFVPDSQHRGTIHARAHSK